VIRLAVRVARADAELVLAELLVLSPSGLEEVEHDDGTVEYAIYGAPGELPALPDLEAAAGEALVRVTTSELHDDWSERWREFHQPVVVGERVRVRPPWSAADGGPGLIDIAIDPGQAFGTGAHATTRLCLELLLGLKPEGALIDVGCGSGVLAIAAAKLGFPPVIAIDNDRESVAATIANAGANDVVLDVRQLDLRREPLPAAPTVVANLLEPLLLELARGLAPPPPRALIAGGLLVEQADAVARAFELAHGLAQRERREAGEWAALLLSCPS
jgi:ribosomal protein L11 methyltransferase